MKSHETTHKRHQITIKSPQTSDASPCRAPPVASAATPEHGAETPGFQGLPAVGVGAAVSQRQELDGFMVIQCDLMGFMGDLIGFNGDRMGFMGDFMEVASGRQPRTYGLRATIFTGKTVVISTGPWLQVRKL